MDNEPTSDPIFSDEPTFQDPKTSENTEEAKTTEERKASENDELFRGDVNNQDRMIIEQPVSEEIKADEEHFILEEPAHEDFDIRVALEIALRENLREEAGTQYQSCLSTLEQLIRNIVKQPDNPKFRRIRKQNPKFQAAVAKFDYALTIFAVRPTQAVGFEHVEEEEKGNQEEVYYLLEPSFDLLSWYFPDRLLDVIGQLKPSPGQHNSLLNELYKERLKNRSKFLADVHQRRLENPQTLMPQPDSVYQPHSLPKPNMPRRPVVYRSQPQKKARIMTLRDLENAPIQNPQPVYHSISDFTDLRNIGLRAFHLVSSRQSNEFRASLNLSPLVWDDRIATICMQHSVNMGDGKVPFSHQGFNERARQMPFSFVRGCAENVAWNHGYSDPAKVTVDGWIQSPGHRKNLVGNFKFMAVAAYRNQRGAFYLTQMFVLAAF